MSSLGLCLFIKRKDKKDIEKEEQSLLLSLIAEVSAVAKVKKAEGKLALPQKYDYDGYEEKSLGVLILSSSVAAEMPEELQHDWQKKEEKYITKITKFIDSITSKSYLYDFYHVEF